MEKRIRNGLLFLVFFAFFWEVLVPRGNNSNNLPSTRKGVWLRGDTHCHTDHSDGGLKSIFALLPADNHVQSQVLRAKKKELDFLLITDHRTLSPIYNPDYIRGGRDLLLIPAEEWGIDVHATLWGIREEIENYSGVQGLRWAALLTKAQGGIVVAAHPARPKRSWFEEGHWNIEMLDAYEGWSTGWFGNPFAKNPLAIELWEKRYLNAGKKIALVGSSDNHFRQINFLSGVGNPTTVVFAKEYTQAALFEGIRRGHVYIISGRRNLALNFEGDFDGDGVYETWMGEENRVRSDSIQLRLRTRGAKGMVAKLFSDQGLVQKKWLTRNELIFKLPKEKLGKWYRIEIAFLSIFVEALTNPIYIRRSGF